MLFAIQFTYRIAMVPLPTLFVTACSKTNNVNREICISTIFSTLVTNLELAISEYQAIIISNEPSAITHDLKRAGSEDFATVCCSLHFKSIDDIRGFIAKITHEYN